jgi:TolA protein
MAEKFALIIGNSRYEDSRLGRLKAPEADVRELESVLRSPNIGQFSEVMTLRDESCAVVRKAVARFYDQRKRDDLLFLYFSGHGVKDEQGHLYLALRDTEVGLLSGTAIETSFISARMDRSFSKRQVLVLDCCHSGAFAHGTKSAQGVSVGTAEAFEGTGLGRVILTATDATQYALDDDSVEGEPQNSVFTRYLIEGLKSGAADQDSDGVVTVDELYDYVRDHVVSTTPRQTPYKWSYRQQGEIVLAHNPFVKSGTLPPEIQDAIASSSSNVRVNVVADLQALLGGQDAGQSRAALAALKDLTQDDSRKVANAAIEALKAHDDADDRRVAPPPLPTTKDDRRPAGPPESPAEDRAESRPSDVFISYAREDQEAAKALARVLSAKGWRIWWDRKIAPGEAFDKVIEHNLKTCKCAIVLWSAHSVEATWVRNEARRAARRNVLVPILIDAVETPLEFDNLQAVDLTSWKAPAEHPEFEALFNKIEELAGIPHDTRARLAVERARGEFAAGRHDAAIAILVEFQPAHAQVTAALNDLRREAEGIARKRAEAARRAEEAAQRQRALVAEQTRIHELLERGQLESAERALGAAEREFGARPFASLRARSNSLIARAREDERARTAIEQARRDFAAGQHEAAVASLAAFEPTNALVTAALDELQQEAERIAQYHADAARRAKEAAQRQRALVAERARVDDLLEQGQLVAADRALTAAEQQFGVAELASYRARWSALAAKASEDDRARSTIEAARGEFAAGRHQVALANLARFRPAHELVTAALEELREEAERLARERAETERVARQQAEAAQRSEQAAQRQRALAAAQTRIDELLGRGQLDDADRVLSAAEQQSGRPALAAYRERWTRLRAQALEDERARTAVDAARRESAAGRPEVAVASLSSFQPTHAFVTAALAELREEAERVVRQHLEEQQRAEEESQRERALADAQTQIDELLGQGQLEAADRALDAAEQEFGRATLLPFRERWNRHQRIEDVVPPDRGLRLFRTRLATAVAAIVTVAVSLWMVRQPPPPVDPVAVQPGNSTTSSSSGTPPQIGDPAVAPPPPAPAAVDTPKPEPPPPAPGQGQQSPRVDERVEAERREALRQQQARQREAELQEEQRKAEAERQAEARKVADAQQEAKRLQDQQAADAAQKAREAEQAQEAKRLQDQKLAADAQAAKKAADAQAQEAKRLQDQKQAADAAAKKAADAQQAQEAKRLHEQKQAEAQTRQDAARFFEAVRGDWVRQEEERTQQTRKQTEELLAMDASCSGTLTRTVSSYERGFAGWKRVDTQTARLTIRCDATGRVSGDVNTRISLDGATLMLGTSRFVRR